MRRSSSEGFAGCALGPGPIRRLVPDVTAYSARLSHRSSLAPKPDGGVPIRSGQVPPPLQQIDPLPQKGLDLLQASVARTSVFEVRGSSSGSRFRIQGRTRNRQPAAAHGLRRANAAILVHARALP
jgi:hypothetical protein